MPQPAQQRYPPTAAMTRIDVVSRHIVSGDPISHDDRSCPDVEAECRSLMLSRPASLPAVIASSPASAAAASDFVFNKPPPDATYASSSPQCYFCTSPILQVPVLEVHQETHDSKVLTFGLPKDVSLNLPVSSCIMLQAKGAGDDGDDVMKPYNPITSNTETGCFKLLVKVYEKGTVSAFVGRLKVGDSVAFSQLKGNVKPFQYPFRNKRRITMLAGGTGITPMFQALHPLLKTPGDKTEIRLVYSNSSPQDIMLKRELDDFAAAYGERFSVTYVVGRSADDRSAISQGWKGEVGWIDEEKVRRLAFPPAADTQIWVCGTPGLYKELAGSRLDPLATDSVLARLGYTSDMVWRS